MKNIPISTFLLYNVRDWKADIFVQEEKIQ